MLLETVDRIDEDKDKVLEDAKERTIKEAKERNLTIDNLEELLEKMTIIEQIDNFRKREFNSSKNQLNLPVSRPSEEEKALTKNFLKDYVSFLKQEKASLTELDNKEWKEQELEAKIVQVENLVPRIDN